MISVRNRSSQIGKYLKASTSAVPSQSRPVAGAIRDLKDDKIPADPEAMSQRTLAKTLPSSTMTAISGSFTKGHQIRMAHTDIRVPDFSHYRLKARSNPAELSQKSEAGVKLGSYLIVGAGVMGGTYAAKALVTQFVSVLSASADVLALAKIEVKLGDIPEGKNATFKWRGKPLFIRHRTGAEIQRERSVDHSSLRDPQKDEERTQQAKWLIVIGVCTHLGCVPIANAGDYGGYYCPCHGSHYDASGRIRKGPAPLNLEVPAHVFVDDATLVVG